MYNLSRYILLATGMFFGLQSLKPQQNYLVKDDAVWSTVEIHCLPQGTSYSSFFLKFEGDTVVGGIQYDKIHISTDESQAYWELFGLAREDNDHRVYFKPLDYYEGMVYDFDCTVGETIETVNYFLNSDSMSYTVTVIDSVYLDDNIARKRITLVENSTQNEEVWIEGLGSYSGILYSGNNASGGACGSFSALCLTENALMVYQNPVYPACFLSGIVGVEEPDENIFSIYPDPAGNNLNFTTGIPDRYTVDILNSLGSIVLQTSFEGTNEKVNCSFLPRGIYLVRLQGINSRLVNTIKIFKN